METAKLGAALATAWAVALHLALPAEASGQLPVPPETRTFESHQACVAALDLAAAEDRQQVAPRTTDANGDTREVALETKGIERIDATTALYDSTLWFHNGKFRPELQQTETTHSYEHFLRRCDSEVMTITGDRGYTLATFDPPGAAEDATDPLAAWMAAPGHARDGMIELTGKPHGDYHRGYRCPSYEAATFVVSIVEKAHLHEKKPEDLRATLLRSLSGGNCVPAPAGRYRPLQLGNVSVIDNGPEAEEEWTALHVTAPGGEEIGLVYDASVFAFTD